MLRSAVVVLGGVALLALGCTRGARDVDYSRERAISSDIGATLNRGSTAVQPGVTSRSEPIGAIPWEINQRHPPAQ
jgi:hypothetical protein